MASTDVRLKWVILLFFIHCFVASIVLLLPVFNPCFVMQYLESFLVLQSSCRGREGWLLYLDCLHGAVGVLSSSSLCNGFVCCVIVTFPVIITYFFVKSTFI